ncbi:MAG: response regulator, partial [Actinomycetota bacterium]
MTGHEPGGGAGPHVLLVEDSPADAELTLIAIRQDRPEVTVHVVGTADEALAFLRRQHRHEAAPRPDLILLDLNLPGRDGTETTAIIKADSVLRSIPIIMFSNSNADPDVRTAYESGANAYLVKPMEYADIREAMSVLLTFWLRWVCLPTVPVSSGDGSDGVDGPGAADGGIGQDERMISPFSPVAPAISSAPVATTETLATAAMDSMDP